MASRYSHVPERRLAAEAVELPVRRQEDVLQQVLRVGRVAEHPARDAVQTPGMSPVHLLERAQVALPAALDEGQVVLAGRGAALALSR